MKAQTDEGKEKREMRTRMRRGHRMSPRAAGQTGAVSVQSWCDRDSQHFPGQESNLHGSGPISPQDNRLQEGWERIQAPFLYSAVLYKDLPEAHRAPQRKVGTSDILFLPYALAGQ